MIFIRTLYDSALHIYYNVIENHNLKSKQPYHHVHAAFDKSLALL